MATFLALYRGATVSSAELVAVSADNHIVEDFAARLITGPEREEPAPLQPDLHLVGVNNDSELKKEGSVRPRTGTPEHSQA